MKLTAEQVAEIRTSSESSGVLAPRFGVTQSYVCVLRQGDSAKEKRRDTQRRWRDKPGVRERERESARVWREANPDKVAAASRRSNYRITDDEYDGLAIKQDGVCAICRQQKKLHVDHCHETGRVRGLLCMRCNTALGHLGDSVALLERAAQYLKEAAAKAGGHKNG